MKPIQALHNEKLVKEGEYIEEIFFVKRGVLSFGNSITSCFKKWNNSKNGNKEVCQNSKNIWNKKCNLNFLKQGTLSNGNNCSPNELDIPTNEELKNKNGLA